MMVTLELEPEVESLLEKRAKADGCDVRDYVKTLIKKEIVIRSVERPRQGWAEAFQTMAEQGDDQLLDKESSNQSSWDEAEWQW